MVRLIDYLGESIVLVWARRNYVASFVQFKSVKLLPQKREVYIYNIYHLF